MFFRNFLFLCKRKHKNTDNTIQKTSLMFTPTVYLKPVAEQPAWKVILCYSEDEQVNKLIFLCDHEKKTAVPLFGF